MARAVQVHRVTVDAADLQYVASRVLGRDEVLALFCRPAGALAAAAAIPASALRLARMGPASY